MLVYEEKDIGFYVGVGQTQSGRFIIIDAHDHQTNEAYLIDADAPDERAAAGRARVSTATSIRWTTTATGCSS